MCNYVSLLSQKQELEAFYGATYEGKPYDHDFKINGFANPTLPIIMDENTDLILPAEWGLIPTWSRNRDFQKKTLNARIETANELKSYKDAVNQRCLILVNGFHEWKWLDEKGKCKEQYLVKVKDQAVFSLGGLYTIWTDPQTGVETTTFTIVTTEANELMSQIHNTKYRMPILLNKQNQYRWLDDLPLDDFALPHYDPVLEVSVVEK